jgi:hypothetical protein
MAQAAGTIRGEECPSLHELFDRTPSLVRVGGLPVVKSTITL